MKDIKKLNKEFWSRNVPGLNRAKSLVSEINRDFFIEADEYRIKNEPYIIPLVESISQNGEKVLEVGCGMGMDSRNFSRKKSNIVSVDLSFDNVSLTKKGMELCDLQGEVVCSDAEKLPFKNESFDAYYSFGVLHHTPNTQQAVEEAYRVLKKGGKCIVMLYHKGYAYLYINLRFGIKRMFVSEEKLLSDHYDYTPLSKMYSRSDAKRLFNKFKEVKLEVTTFAFGGIDVDPRLRGIHVLLKNRFLMNHFGQFLIIKAQK